MSRWYATVAHVQVVLFVSLAAMAYLTGQWGFKAGAVVSALGLMGALWKLQELCKVDDHVRSVQVLLAAQKDRTQ